MWMCVCVGVGEGGGGRWKEDRQKKAVKPQLREESGERDRESFLPKGSHLNCPRVK